MATSRTGTTKYMRNRKRVLDKAKREGLTHCPGWTGQDGSHHPCGRPLDWDNAGTEASVEADHIIPPAYGGTDDADNLAPLCRKCNITKGDGSHAPAGFDAPENFPSSRTW